MRNSSGRLTVSAARTSVVLLIRRTVRPSGIYIGRGRQPRCLGQFQLSFLLKPRWVPRFSGKVRSTSPPYFLGNTGKGALLPFPFTATRLVWSWTRAVGVDQAALAKRELVSDKALEALSLTRTKKAP